MRRFVRCRSCRLPLSAVLDRDIGGADTNHADGTPFVPAGSLHLSDGEFFTGTEGRYIINLADRRNLTVHTDVKRVAGCCGLDGCDGPNQLCACGAEVATEKSDCWMPHAVIFEPDAVDLGEEAG
jgi:hypothetical protein